MYSYVYLCILMYTYVYFCLLPACLPSWLAGILTSGGPRLRLVKFLNDSIKKIKHLELWKSHAQFLCTLMPWVCKIIQGYA